VSRRPFRRQGSDIALFPEITSSVTFFACRQELNWYSRAIASKDNLAHFERMENKLFASLFVRLALHAALCGAGLVTIYTALDRILLWLGLAPK
jgi:hypothetical protein